MLVDTGRRLRMRCQRCHSAFILRDFGSDRALPAPCPWCESWDYGIVPDNHSILYLMILGGLGLIVAYLLRHPQVLGCIVGR